MAAEILQEIESEISSITAMWGHLGRDGLPSPVPPTKGRLVNMMFLTSTIVAGEGALVILFRVPLHGVIWPVPLPSSPLAVLAACAVWFFTFTPLIWYGLTGKAGRDEWEAALGGMLLLPCLAASMLLASQQTNRTLPWLVFIGICITLLPADMRGPAVARKWLREKVGALAVALATGLIIFTQGSPNVAAPASPPQAGMVAAGAADRRTIARSTTTPSQPMGNKQRLPQSTPAAKTPVYVIVTFRSYHRAIHADLSELYARRSKSGYHLYRLETGVPRPGGAMRPVTAALIVKLHRQFASAVYPASPRQIRVESAKAARNINFFASDGSPLIWWTRAESGRYLIFNGPGLDPHNGARLRPANQSMAARILREFTGGAVPAVYIPVAFRSYRHAISADLSGLYVRRGENGYHLYRLETGVPRPGGAMRPVTAALIAKLHRQFASAVYPASPRQIRVESAKAARNINFFASDGSPLIWWARSKSGQYLLFDGPGLDPHNGARLRPAGRGSVAKILRQLTEETVYPAK